MFSRRLDWRAAANPVARALETRRPVYDLTASNPTQCGLHYDRELLRAFEQPGALVYEPDARGLGSARDALGLGPCSLLASSTSEVYSWLFKLLCDPGDEILVPRPSYPLFEFLAGLESVRVKQYSLRYSEGWWLDFDSLRTGLTDRTRAILFVHPNNPTGQFLKTVELDELAALCSERNLALISDEVFLDYPLRDDPARCATLGDNGQCLTFVFGGLSKTAGLPQMKAAWVTASGPGSEEAARALELIADTYLSVSTPVQHALPMLLRHGMEVRGQIRERTRENLAALLASGLRPLDVEGGWYATIATPREWTEDEWIVRLLDLHGVLVQPGYFYDFESDGWLVLSLLTEPRVFRTGAAAIAKELAR
ncbi:MAG: pyridoxal phosphate-dependent aminotransferase [Acidobacteria bacterium]|nr:pyridoxal phosphate-dependent aminotransferase [Acidobacteriota bacterium]